MNIFINGNKFLLNTTQRMLAWYPVFIDGVGYGVDNKERLQSVAHSQAEELQITAEGSNVKEITILDRVWVRNAYGEYRRKLDPALPFPHAGQVVSLDGVEVEVLHMDRGLVFWYNPEDEIHGMVKACKLKSSLVETLRADLAKGLEPKELIALGWSRKIS
jgi:hypothetical protein